MIPIARAYATFLMPQVKDDNTVTYQNCCMESTAYRDFAVDPRSVWIGGLPRGIQGQDILDALLSLW